MATYILRNLYNIIYNPDVLPGGTMMNGVETFDFNNTVGALNYLPAGAHTITHASGDRLVTADASALYLANPVAGGVYLPTATFTFTLNINGVLSGTTQDGLVLENYRSIAANKITVGKDGSIGGVDTAVYTSALTNIDNNGVISSGDTGRTIVFDGFYFAGDASNIKPTTITTINNNLGAVIYGGTHGIMYNALGKLVINNKGILVGGEATADADDVANAIQSFDGTVVLTNDITGLISGTIRTGWLNSAITNKGVIEGTIRAHMYGEQVDPMDPDSPLTGYIDYNRNGTPAFQLGDKHLNLVTETAITITNSGTIDGTNNWWQGPNGPIEAALDLTNGKDIVKNTGLIYGEIYTRSGNDTVDNAISGKIYGDVAVGSGDYYQGFGAYALDADIVTNNGLIDGSVYTDMGKDVVTNNGEITGRVEIGTGNYDAANATGEDYDTLTNTGIIQGNVWTGLGDDIVTNSGTMRNGLDTSAWPGFYDALTDSWTWQNDPLSLFDNDKDKLTNTGVIFGGVSMGHGADIATNSNLINGDLEVGTYSWVGNPDDGIPYAVVDQTNLQADDKDTVTNTGTITGYIWSGLGADVITNNGYTAGIFTTDNDRTVTTTTGDLMITIPGNAGTFDIDTVTNTGTVRDEIWTGVGDDKIFNKITGKVTDGGIYAGDGVDVIENDGFVARDVHGGRGSDTITNRGTIGGNVYLGTDGATNKLINLKFINGSVRGDYNAVDGQPDVAAQGNNTIDNSGTIAGEIFLGSGSDNVKNLAAGRIEGEIRLGAGIDFFTGNASNEYIVDEAGGDTYIMGAGNDTVEIGVVDLDQDTFDGGLGTDSLDLSNVISSIGVAVNLSVVLAQTIGYTGVQPDKALNFENVYGGNGNDSLVGSAVTNIIKGGSGNDGITGGGGQDFLSGGLGTDVFVYNLVTDSTLGAADIIRDFNVLDDSIDLAFVAGTLTLSGAFSAITTLGDAQWRSSFVGGNTVLEVNNDADLAADFIIYLAGNIALTGADFI